MLDRYKAHYYYLRYAAVHKGFWYTDYKILYLYTWARTKNITLQHFLLFFSISVYHKFTSWFTFALIARVETVISVMTLSFDNNINYKIVGCHPGCDKYVGMTACYRLHAVNGLVNGCLYENNYKDFDRNVSVIFQNFAAQYRSAQSFRWSKGHVQANCIVLYFAHLWHTQLQPVSYLNVFSRNAKRINGCGHYFQLSPWFLPAALGLLCNPIKNISHVNDQTEKLIIQSCNWPNFTSHQIRDVWHHRSDDALCDMMSSLPMSHTVRQTERR